jgi:hypothetical protein
LVIFHYMHFCFHKRLSKGEDGLVFHSLSSQTEPDPTNPWGNDSSIVRLFHLWPLYLFQSLVDRLGGIQLGVYQRLCFLPRHPCRCLLSCGVRLGVENKKAVKTDPGGKTPQLLADALPQSGSGSDLTAFMLRFPHLTFALILSTRLMTCQDLPTRMGTGEELPEAAQAFRRQQHEPVSPHACRLLVAGCDSSVCCVNSQSFSKL